MNIRRKLYGHILEMNIGWFDDKSHGASVLTSAMAEDTGVINGVGAESIAPQADGYSGLVIGLAVGFYFCWQQSLVVMATVPLLVIAKLVNFKASKGLGDVQHELMKDADLLCGDAILNYRTV